MHLKYKCNFIQDYAKCGKHFKNGDHKGFVQHSKVYGKKPQFFCIYCPYKSIFQTNLKKHLCNNYKQKANGKTNKKTNNAEILITSRKYFYYSLLKHNF